MALAAPAFEISNPVFGKQCHVNVSIFKTEYGRVVACFYFNLCNGAEFVEDEEGVDFPDLAAARQNAVNGLRGVMAGDLLRGDMNMASFIEIENERHEFIETICFADVVNLRDEPSPRRSSKPH